ncbi:MAG: DUF6049 family protein [Micrococcales bacterium]|nr:DUF6049 family protein [Micrococcales bacterium]
MNRWRLARAHAALAAGLLAVASAIPAAASTARAPAPPSGLAAPGGVAVEVVSITPQVLDVTSDERITVTARVSNTTSEPVTGARVALALASVNMRTRVDVERWADGTMPAEPTQLVAVDLTTLEPGTSVDVRLVGRAPTLINEWGPRGLVVSLAAGRIQAETRTFLLVQSNQAIPRAPVALLAALTGPAAAPELPAVGASTGQSLDSVTLDRIAQVVAAVAGSPQVGLAVDPALVATSSADLLTEVLADREVLTLPWGDPDLQALAAAGALDLLTVARTLADAPGRTLAVWSLDPVDAQTAEAVRAAGSTWLIAPDARRGAATMLTTPQGELVQLHPDDDVSALFDGSTDLTAAQAQQLAMALLATAARGAGGPTGVLVVTARDWLGDAQWTAGFVAALASAPWVELTTTSALAAADDLPRTTPDPATPDGAIGIYELDAARHDLAEFAAVTAEPAVVTAGVDEATLQVASYAWRTDPRGRGTATSALRSAIGERRNGLRLTQPSTWNLFSSAGEIRFNVRNDLPVAASVRVQLEPEKACLAGEAKPVPAGRAAAARVGPIWSQVVTVEPHSDTPVPVALSARANCDVDIRATLVGADGTAVTTTPVTFSARVRPQIESVGTTVVGVLVGLGLILGLVRTVRRGQSARRGNRTTTEPVRVGVLGGETPIAGIPVAKMLTPITGIPVSKMLTPIAGIPKVLTPNRGARKARAGEDEV